MRRVFWLASLVLALQARAEDRLHVDVHGSGGRDYQVAVQRFSAGEGALEFPGPFYEELTRGLTFSSVFKVVDPEAFLEPVQTQNFEASRVPCENWRAIGADALVEGKLERARKTIERLRESDDLGHATREAGTGREPAVDPAAADVPPSQSPGGGK